MRGVDGHRARGDSRDVAHRVVASDRRGKADRVEPTPLSSCVRGDVFERVVDALVHVHVLVVVVCFVCRAEVERQRLVLTVVVFLVHLLLDRLFEVRDGVLAVPVQMRVLFLRIRFARRIRVQVGIGGLILRRFLAVDRRRLLRLVVLDRSTPLALADECTGHSRVIAAVRVVRVAAAARAGRRIVRRGRVGRRVGVAGCASDRLGLLIGCGRWRDVGLEDSGRGG